MASITKRGRYWRAQIVRRGYPPQYRTFDSRSEAEAWARVLESEHKIYPLAVRLIAEGKARVVVSTSAARCDAVGRTSQR